MGTLFYGEFKSVSRGPLLYNFNREKYQSQFDSILIVRKIVLFKFIFKSIPGTNQ